MVVGKKTNAKGMKGEKRKRKECNGAQRKNGVN